MAISKIKGNEIREFKGTTPNETGAHVVNDVFPEGSTLISGQYKTSYNQWRPFANGVGQGSTGSALIFLDLTTGEINRPYILVARVPQ